MHVVARYAFAVLPILAVACSAASEDGATNEADPTIPTVNEVDGELQPPPRPEGSEESEPSEEPKREIPCGEEGADPACDEGKGCKNGSECTSGVCLSGACLPATSADGVKNADETDIDCGGKLTKAPKCAVGKSCITHTDCASDACSYAGKCVAEPSCTGHFGGDTCGVGEVGAAGAKHESCCKNAAVAGSTVKLDKYHITAGRMRTFIERLNGNVKAFVKTLPASKWNTAWNAYVPGNVAEADKMLGSYWNGAPNDSDGQNSKRSCAPGTSTGRTYWTAPSGADYSDFTKDQLDVKALNCVGWHLVKAFCAWDGGRLATVSELMAAYTNNGTTTYPWGNSYNEKAQDARLNHRYNYGFPMVPNMRVSGNSALDIAWYISPPGRFPTGLNKTGHEIAGNLLHYTNDEEYGYLYSLSWELHGGPTGLKNWKKTWPGEPNGYYAVGARCARD